MELLSQISHSLGKLAQKNNGVSLVELLLAVAIAGLVMPAIISGFITSRQGHIQQSQREEAVSYFREAQEAVRSVREAGWAGFAVNGTFYPRIQGGAWQLVAGTQTTGDFTRLIVISDVFRNGSGQIVTSGGTLDPSTKRVVVTVGWNVPYSSQISSTLYLTRYLNNLSYLQSTQADFNGNTLTQSAVTNTSGGEVQLANNLKAKWCSPSFATTTIDLPDGPPVAVSATASAVSTTIPNDIFTVTSPFATSSTKLAYVTVPANVDPPTATLKGTFTLDPALYSSVGLVPTGIGLDNDFITNTVKYYRSTGGKLYALIGTTKPDKEVIVVQINDGTGDAWQDSVNKIYKYWTFFNTRRYEGNSQSLPNQDQSPFGYGGVSLAVLGNRGYVASGGYLYVIDLSNIDSKSPSNGLDEVGCRIELDGFDCNPGSGTDRKYSSGETGTTWSTTTGAAHLDCSDGGNIELYANNDLFPVQVGSSTYVYVAVGAGTNPEFNIVNVTNVPTSSSSPRINNNSCGRITGGNAGWRRISSLDFNSNSGTEEAANSVFANAEGTRAYISSNGGVDSNGDGQDDSKQFYILNTTNKSSPAFLSGNSSTGPTSGYYTGSTENKEMHPQRSLTVLNGQRVVLVGSDSTVNANNAEEYQVLNSSTESSPTYCAGIDYDQGFNDLTSVTEADFDTFVYMVANTDEKQLKIIQGGPDGTYSNTGTMESAPLNAGFETTFNRYMATFSLPTNTTLKFQFAGADPVSGSCTGSTYSYTGPDGSTGTYYTATTSAIFVGTSGGYKNPAQCFRYKTYFDTTDYNATPVLTDMTINYSP